MTPVLSLLRTKVRRVFGPLSVSCLVILMFYLEEDHNLYFSLIKEEQKMLSSNSSQIHTFIYQVVSFLFYSIVLFQSMTKKHIIITYIITVKDLKSFTETTVYLKYE